MNTEISEATMMTWRKEPIDIMEIGCAFAHAETITRRDIEFISDDELLQINDLLSKTTDVFAAIHELSLAANELNNEYYKAHHCNCAACINRNEKEEKNNGEK